jgi:hypothetical protein
MTHIGRQRCEEAIVIRMLMSWAVFLPALAGVLRADAAAERPQRILFVGNSYTNGSWQAISTVFGAEDPGVVIQKQTAGGAKLSAWTRQPGLLKIIRDGNWDYVVLQEQSQLPSLPGEHVQSFFDAATALDKHIRDSGAQTVFFMTWGRRDGDRHNRAINPDFETMQRRLSVSYRSIAERLGAVLAPVGEAYGELRKTKPDLFPRLYKNDGSHPALGAYVAAFCLYRAIYGQMPEKHLRAADAWPASRPGKETSLEILRAIHDAVEAVFEPDLRD